MNKNRNISISQALEKYGRNFSDTAIIVSMTVIAA